MPYRIRITGLVHGDRKIQTIKGIREADHILCAFENRARMTLREAKDVADKAEKLGQEALLFDGLSEHRGKLLAYALELNEVPCALEEEMPEYTVSLTADEIRALYFRGTSPSADRKLANALDAAGLPMIESAALSDDMFDAPDDLSDARYHGDDIPF